MRRRLTFLPIASGLLMLVLSGCGDISALIPATPTRQPLTATTPTSEAPTAAPIAATLTAGPASCEVPQIVGKAVGVAQGLIGGMGLQSVKSVVYDPNTPADSVIAQDPAGGTILNPCAGMVKIVVSLGAEPTSAPSATITPTDTPMPTAAPTSEPTPTSIPSPVVPAELPTGDWSVRSYNTDDIGAVFVNGHMVVVTTRNGDSNWVNINKALVPGLNELIVVSRDYWERTDGIYMPAYSWGFGVRHGDIQVWGNEQPRVVLQESPGRITYLQRLRLYPNGTIEPYAGDSSAPHPPAGKWYVRPQVTNGVSAVLVNGTPVIIGSNDWTEITGQLADDRDNTIMLLVWNSGGEYAYNFSIKHDETIVWGAEKKGSDQGMVLEQPVIVTGAGQVKP